MMCLCYIRYCLVQRIMEINYKENLCLQTKMLTELEGNFVRGEGGTKITTHNDASCVAICVLCVDTHEVQGWGSAESNRFPPMWPGFDSQIQHHMWVEFVASLLCTERFLPRFPSPPKPAFHLICVKIIVNFIVLLVTFAFK